LLVLVASLLASLLGSCAEDEGGVLDEDEDDGVLLEPAPAEPLMPLEAGAEDEDDDEAPPLAWSFFWMSTEVDDELEPEGAVLGVVAPEDEDELPEGAVVAPDGARSVVQR
jgi:hypothetical protein